MWELSSSGSDSDGEQEHALGAPPPLHEHLSRSRSPRRLAIATPCRADLKNPKPTSQSAQFQVDVPAIPGVEHWQMPLLDATKAFRSELAARGLARTPVLESLCSGLAPEALVVQAIQ